MAQFVVNNTSVDNIISSIKILTGRYSGSAESVIDYDIKRFTEQDPEQFLKNT